MYKVVVAPSLSNTLVDYAVKCAIDNGAECAERLIASYDKAVDLLESMPRRGCRRAVYIPEKYRLITFWKHLWLVYQIEESSKTVYIDFLIDDRSDYGKLIQ